MRSADSRECLRSASAWTARRRRARPGTVAAGGLLTLLFSVAPAFAAPVFVDVAAPAGINHIQHSTWLTEPSHVFITGGAAAGDYDRDGWVDLFVTRWDLPSILYRNQGNGTFADVTVAAGIGTELNSNGAAWVDVDKDGDLDLYVNGVLNERHYLYINDGNGAFTDQAPTRGVATATSSTHRSFGIAVGDYDNDGWVDIHTVEQDPDENSFSHSRLFRNQGAANPGFFTDETVAAGVDAYNYPGLPAPEVHVRGFAPRFTDLDNDRWPDLAIVADWITSRLFWNDADGTFTDGTVAASVGTDGNGMGSAVGDYNGDGLLDWFVTAIYDPDDTLVPYFPTALPDGNRLYMNLGNRQFLDVTDAAGVRDGGWGWAAAFFDYDNDGDLDLTMTNGMYSPEILVNIFLDDQARLWRNDGNGSMTDVATTSGMTDQAEGKGLLTFDYDNDGDLDVFVTVNGDVPILYRNDGGNADPWLRVDVVGNASNRDGFGARVIVTPSQGGPSQMREISGGSHYIGQSEFTAHFGLGSLVGNVHRVQVYWPASGETQEMTNVAPSQTLTFTETATSLCIASGTCTPCDDGDPCTDDSWDDVGGCVHPPNTDPCDDSDPCTTGDVCDGAGACSGTPVICSGLDDDCNVGVCNSGSGACGVDPRPAGASCSDDGDACTDDECNGAGACAHPFNTGPCDDGDVCTSVDLCDGSGGCTGAPVDCSGIDDACNLGVCDAQSGSCVPSPRVAGTACPDEGDVCTTDVCDGAGGCAHPFSTAPCDDGQACTHTDACDGAGTCSGSPVDCSSLDDACNVGVCNAGSGACETSPRSDGTACDDSLFCTAVDTCTAGACSGAGDPCAGGGQCNVICDEAANGCHDPSGTPCTAPSGDCTDSVCDGAGACIVANNSDPCDDGNACTVNDTCTAGTCTGTPASAGATCDDGDLCTDGDSCDGAGACTSGPATDCSDGTLCTQDSCDPGGGCSHEPDPFPVCGEASGTALQVRSKGDRSTLRFKFKRTAVDGGDVGDPGAPGGTDHEICVYTNTLGSAQISLSARMPAGGTCGKKPCWKITGAPPRLRYSDSEQSPDGVRTAKLTVGPQAKCTLKAGGLNLSMPAPAGPEDLIDASSGVLVQLRTEAGGCWSMTVDPAGEDISSRDDSFKVKQP